MKILVMGLPGSGKTYLTERLVPLLNAAWYNADKVRDVIIILSIQKLERESSSLEGTAVERQLRPISQDMVTLWMSIKS